MNIEIIFCALGIILIIALLCGMFTVIAITNPIIKKINTISFIVIFIVIGLSGLNFVNFHIGKQQEPIITAEITEQMPIDITSTHYENGKLFVTTISKDLIHIPDDTVILKPVITVKKIFIRKEWNFIIPFYLEETKYEYIDNEIV